MTDPRLLGAVLCGGRSSRMGRDKALLRDSYGCSYLQLAVQRLQGLCDSVCVCGSSSQFENITFRSMPGVRFISDPEEHLGPAIGVAAALRIAKDEAFAGCLVNPVDTPKLNLDDLRLLQQNWLQDPNRVVCAQDAQTGHLQPLVAIYPTSAFESVSKLAASADRSLRRWLEQHQPETANLPASSLLNVNRPEDLAGAD